MKRVTSWQKTSGKLLYVKMNNSNPLNYITAINKITKENYCFVWAH